MRGIVLYPPDGRAHWSDQTLSLVGTIDYLLPFDFQGLPAAEDSSCSPAAGGVVCVLAIVAGPFKTCYANRTADVSLPDDSRCESQLIVNGDRSSFSCRAERAHRPIAMAINASSGER